MGVDTGAEDAIQVSLLTGWLGSGKTTLLNALLKHPDMAETAVLVNEFGDIGIDHQLVDSVDENMVELTTGCLCCTVQGDLSRSLRELFLKRVKGEVTQFRRVLIETTGLADPAPILHTLMNDPIIASRFYLDGVISTSDAVFGQGQLDRHEEPRKQAAVADRIVMTKVDMAEDDAKDALEQRLKELNPSAHIFRAANGEIAPDNLFGCGLYDPDSKSFDVQNWLRDEAFREDHEHSRHDHNHEDGHDHDHIHDPERHGDGISSFCMRYEDPIEWPAFVAWIQTLITHRGENLLRIKGIVNIDGEDNPVAIHGVQHVFHPPVRLPEWPSEDHDTRIVFITRELEQKVILDSLDALQQAAKGSD
ncbi:MAG: GTP-binding protein [Rhodospirillaceae bacterium]|nr:GTP-binding protein [Rhodospirillaceae bacterium]